MDPNSEVLDRVRRIETRLTRYLEAQGFETGARKPTFHKGTLIVPTKAISLNDMLGAVPEGWSSEEEIEVIFEGKRITSIYVR